jgi:hypothetical protein
VLGTTRLRPWFGLTQLDVAAGCTIGAADDRGSSLLQFKQRHQNGGVVSP